MDVIKNVVEAAENYLWGNDEASNTLSGEEPVAGVQGKGTAADPYDSGNAPKDLALEHAKESAEQTKNEGGGTTHESENQGTIPHGFVPGSGSSTTPSGGQVRKTERSKTEPDVVVKNPLAGASGGFTANAHSETSSMPITSPPMLATPATSRNPPAAGVLSQDTHLPPPLQASIAEASGGRGSSKGSEHHAAAAGAAAAARMAPPPTGTSHVSAPQKPNAASARGQPRTQNPPLEEHHVFSTGYAAEGGDFDAAEPGAGREADRLLAEHHQEVSLGKNGPGKEPKAQSPQSKPSSAPQHEKNAGNDGGSNQNNTPSQHHSIPHPSLSHLKEKLHKGGKHYS
ncbi:hypothetical protein BDDG_08748 [Blastomyces dermatitidis ATCC 18188]|uniref:Solid-state culture expressed protein n=1 Tax=Ajellomyces dermatitidis (strain ATCC 18188 / CBS 674.68) TaxID=653446 RepID=F2TRE0_AJEDA|nr:hypothetical protein BDDG_08748 [Blastomyces dermatitidis ATCC 18188]